MRLKLCKPEADLHQEDESTEIDYPPFAWREVGRLAQDLTFEKGPATSFALVFDPLDNTPYLAFTVHNSLTFLCLIQISGC